MSVARDHNRVGDPSIDVGARLVKGFSPDECGRFVWSAVFHSPSVYGAPARRSRISPSVRSRPPRGESDEITHTYDLSVTPNFHYWTNSHYCTTNPTHITVVYRVQTRFGIGHYGVLLRSRARQINRSDDRVALLAAQTRYAARCVSYGFNYAIDLKFANIRIRRLRRFGCRIGMDNVVHNVGE